MLAAFGFCVAAPKVTTDCKSLVTIAATGTLRATAASAPLAGIWSAIAAAFGRDLCGLVDDGLLTWMPAHLSASTAVQARASDGSEVTYTAWRANRLADAIARRIATRMLADPKAVRHLPTEMNTIMAEAAALGAVTYAANNHKVATVRADGAVGHELARDADACNVRPASVAARPWRKREPKPPPEPKVVQVLDERAPVRERREAAIARQRDTRERNRLARAASDHRLREVLAERSRRTRSRSPAPLLLQRGRRTSRPQPRRASRARRAY